MSVEREEMEFDVLLVGAGPSNLACAIHLMSLVSKHNDLVSKGMEQGKIIDIEDKIAVIEKGAYVGAHGFSGAVMDPVIIKELLPDFLDRSFPYESKVAKDEVYWLSHKKSYKLPFLPSSLNNNNNYIISISKMTAWMSEIAEEMGVIVLPGYSGVKILYDNNKVIGVQTNDKEVDDKGVPKALGYRLKAKITVFGEGPRGSLTKQLIPKFNLDKDKNVSTYELGCKEIWELPEGRVEKGKVVHTLGFPLDKRKPGGGFIYHLSNNRLAIGLVTYLSSKDPFLDTQRELQNWKKHPYLKAILEGGKPVYFGSKVLPSGGYYSIPKLAVDGALIVGDSANMLNTKRLKGIHLAMKSGMLAAETIFEAIKKNDFSKNQINEYEKKVHTSIIKTELYKVRNFSQVMTKGFPFPAIFHIASQMITNGAGLTGRIKAEPNNTSTQSIEQFYGNKVPSNEKLRSDDNLIVDKLSDVFLSNTTHNEKQRSHIQIRDQAICKEECYAKYQSPCTKYCPANVYEMIQSDNGDDSIKVNFANCVHCKAADLKCPYNNITWMPPEGGDGPKYTML